MSVASLNETLEEKKKAKYDPALEQELRQWMATMLQDSTLTSPQPLQELLKDGVVLCRLANRFVPDIIPRVNSSSLPFKQMENISSYTAACIKIGLKPAEIFETNDLYQGKDMMKVLQHLYIMRMNSEKLSAEYLKKQEGKSNTNEGSSNEAASIKRSNLSRSVAITKPLSPTASKSNSMFAGRQSMPVQRSSSPSSSPKSPNRVANEAQITESLASSPSLESRKSGVKQNVPSVTSLHDDVVTKEEFKYSFEVQAVAQRWIEAVIKEPFPTGVTFAEALKSGVILCKLINVVRPGSVAKINTANIPYLQMENIEQYLKACSALGLRGSDLFNTSDLFEAKNMSIVLGHIIVLGNTLRKMNTWNGPQIEDSKQYKTLWAESLVMVEIKDEDFENEDGKEISEEQQELILWVNSQLTKNNYASIRNLSSNFRSSVVLIHLLEVLTGQYVPVYEDAPKYLWQYINNASAALRFLASHTFELVPGCSARDIVNGNVSAITTLLKYLRDKFDLEFLFNKVLDQDLDESDLNDEDYFMEQSIELQKEVEIIDTSKYDEQQERERERERELLAEKEERERKERHDREERERHERKEREKREKDEMERREKERKESEKQREESEKKRINRQRKKSTGRKGK